MARKVFFSFHFDNDSWRASTVRSIGALEGNEPVQDNTWEEIKRGGDAAIKAWIAKEMAGRTCAVVLIGSETANRKWINHEIVKSWNDGLGVVGIYIHNLKDRLQRQSYKGQNPFDYVTFESGSSLSSVVKVYDPPYFDSKLVYGHIAQNIAIWVDEAIQLRNR